ncbi:MAG: 30S ribosomal protein S6 [Planctomycetes bacterium]|nr:30S ribosomal protein S6 [Planctomycetota bacterium]
MRNYEGMFLVDPTVATREWNRIVEEIERILKRNGAAVILLTKWGERKLSYHVKRNARGAYVLAYFAAAEKSLVKIRADFQLSELVLRSLILRHEGEFRKEPPKDFETAGLVPIRSNVEGAGEDRPRHTRSFEAR